MDLSSYVLLSQEQALKRRLDIVANNMANSSTVGFKREQPVFREYIEQNTDAPVNDAKPVSFVLDYGTIHDFSQGEFQTTGNPLDLMIEGPGYFSVETPNGGTAYTRAGFVKLLPSGDLATSSGHRLLDDQGQPINVPPEQIPGLSIARDGTVSGKAGQIARLGVTVFGNEASVDPRGDGLFSGTGGRLLDATETQLKSGGVEGSNVQPVVETTAMIDILRTYQTSVKLSESMNDLRKRALDRLGHVS